MTHREPADAEMRRESADTEVIGPPVPPRPPAKPVPGRFPWRKVRMWALIVGAVMILVPGVAFIIGWFIYDAPDPAEIAKKQSAAISISYMDGNTEMVKASGAKENRTVITHDKIAPVMLKAMMAAEDPSFETNKGFDPFGVIRAVISQTGLLPQSGGSGITQQYVKKANNDEASTFARKYREIIAAAKLTTQHDKDDIITGYMNTVFFGRTGWGIEEASRAYFDKSAKDLQLNEAAFIAGLVQQPKEGDPAEVTPYAKKRWEYTLDQMVKHEMITKQERDAQKLPTPVDPEKSAGKASKGPFKHIQDRVLEELSIPEIGLTEEAVRKNNYRIISTIDQTAQTQAVDTARKVMKDQPENLRAAMVSVETRSGSVRAYYGGEYGTNNRYLDYANRMQEPGSSFKPFALAAGLNKGIGLGKTYSNKSGARFPHYPHPVYNAVRGQPCGDKCSLAVAMEWSVNTSFIDMITSGDVPADAVRDAGHEAGIPKAYPAGGNTTVPTLEDREDHTTGAGIALGQYGVHVTDMANAYATFGNDGKRNQAHFIAKIVDPSGAPVYEATLKNERAFESDVARTVTKSLIPVASHSKLALAGSRESASKTGTHQFGEGDGQENSKAWMVGYTPEVSTAVWVGADMNEAIKGIYGGGPKHNIFGANEPGQMWRLFMDGYLGSKSKSTFAKPSKVIGQEEAPETTTPSTTPPTSSSRPGLPIPDLPSIPLPSCGLFGCPDKPSTTPSKPDPSIPTGRPTPPGRPNDS
ncbi:penicillin-binding protein [Pseudonocardiaceae bacterium YIM PH 21723]|nr:penicillin-binding protein [Pseudonocardiaceae bacterium YIM PH 21723]